MTMNEHVCAMLPAATILDVDSFLTASTSTKIVPSYH